MEGRLRSLHRADLLEVAPDRAMATVLFGGLTEAGLAAARGDGDPDDLFDAFLRLVRHLAPAGSADVLV